MPSKDREKLRAYQREWRAQRTEAQRAARREYMVEWRKKRAEHLAEYATQYREANRDKIAAYRRAYLAKWRAKNQERLLEQKREWYRKHRNRILAERREYAELHPEVVARWTENSRVRRREASRLAARERYAKHPEKWRGYAHARRSRKLAAGGSFTAKDVAAQRQRQRGKCFYCADRLKTGFHVDHVVPLSRGGDNSPGNIVLACPPCNRRKGNKMPAEFHGRLL